ncbi:MAG: flagellar biosynthetic protein FliO [Dehalobacterium sp.]
MDQIWWTFIKMVIMLPLVLILLLIVLRYNLKPMHQQWSRNRFIRVVDRVFLDKNTSISIIEVDGFFYLVGSQQGQLTVLDKLEGLNLESEPDAVNYNNFEEILGAKIKSFSCSVSQHFFRGKGK